MKVLLVGAGAREHAMGRALVRTDGVELFTVAKTHNPGLEALSAAYEVADESDAEAVVAFATRAGVEFACVGPEAPLAAGVSDALAAAGVRVASPSRAAAEIETNKRFMRELLDRHDVPGNVAFHYFEDGGEARAQLRDGRLRYAIKPLGLTGGKGVRVYGDHFTSVEEAGQYVDEVLAAGAGGHGVLLEELLEGEEFTLQALSDGEHVVPFVAVQDHKRLLPGDRGPNTGGMGSYSQSDGLLPFLPRRDYESAVEIVRGIVAALKAEGRPYVGPIYGQFMLTAEGPRVIEVNARFGDPEAMNVLSLFTGDYADAVRRMTDGTLGEARVGFASLASVVKYVVPEGYGSSPKAGREVRVDEAAVARAGAEVYYASVDAVRAGVVRTTTSRAVAVLGKGETIREANDACEEALTHVTGEGLFVRHDIGTPELIERRLQHMHVITKGA